MADKGPYREPAKLSGTLVLREGRDAAALRFWMAKLTKELATHAEQLTLIADKLGRHRTVVDLKDYAPGQGESVAADFAVDHLDELADDLQSVQLKLMSISARTAALAAGENKFSLRLNTMARMM